MKWPTRKACSSYLAYRRRAKFEVAYLQEAQGCQQGLWPVPSLIDLTYQVGQIRATGHRLS